MNRPPLTTYLKLCTEFYDLEHHQDAQDVAFYMDYACQAHGPILEPMCGTGRFLIQMLQAGFDIEGFDASPHMLNALEQKYKAITNKKPPVWQQFVQDFSSDKRYKLIFVPYGSWGLMTSLEDSKHSLAAMYHHLLPGGKFIVEIETVASVPQPCGIWRRGVHKRADGSLVAINTLTSYDPTTQIFRSICRYESIVQGAVVATETEDFLQYLHRFVEMDDLLANAGFTSIQKYQDYKKTPATDPNAPLIIYECTK